MLVALRTEILLLLVVMLAVACVVLASVFASHSPAASVALLALIAGGVAGFVVEAADGPKDVPATVATVASAGLGIGGLIGLLATRGYPPARSARRAAKWTLAAAPVSGAALTFALQAACPLYVNGKHSSYCNFGGDDLLGGWVSGVVFLFLLSVAWLAVVLWISSWQAEGWPGEGRKR